MNSQKNQILRVEKNLQQRLVSERRRFNAAAHVEGGAKTCHKRTTKKYRTRPSPPISAADCLIGTKRRGNDENVWTVCSHGSTRVWRRTTTKKASKKKPKKKATKKKPKKKAKKKATKKKPKKKATKKKKKKKSYRK